MKLVDVKSNYYLFVRLIMGFAISRSKFGQIKYGNLNAFHNQEENLDYVVFGDEVSEAAPDLMYTNSSTDIGAFEESYRKLEDTDQDNSWIQLKMKVTPNEQNYLTLKFWGSDTLTKRKNLNLYYWREFFFGGGRYDQVGTYGADEPKFINWSTTKPFPERFVYMTYLLPEKMNIVTDTIDFRIANATMPIYKLYTHTNPLFIPDPSEEQGTAPGYSVPYQSPNGKTTIEHVHEQLYLAVDRFLS